MKTKTPDWLAYEWKWYLSRKLATMGLWKRILYHIGEPRSTEHLYIDFLEQTLTNLTTEGQR